MSSTRDWGQRVEDACSQLNRYGGCPNNLEIVEVVDLLSDVNDDIVHGRAASMVSANIDKMIEKLNKLKVDYTASQGGTK